MVKAMEDIVLDQEWVLLIKEAKNIGLSAEEIRLFLSNEG
ncbi:anti-repressor SinI family protein [Radiobacillus sp. PE A8.2]